jgi:DNA polymerase-1
MSTQLLVDGHYLAYRSFFAYPPTLQYNNQPINAIYGFFTLLLKAIELYNPKALAICFDLPKPTFRHELYDLYKATRQPAPEDFKAQIPILIKMLEQCNIPIITAEGYEADDLLGSLAKQAEKLDIKSYILTGDHDSFQLVNNYIQVLIPKKGSPDYDIFTAEKVKEKLGVFPNQVVDFKALKGDSSDNIPGISGIGDKTAAKLIEDYHSLENIYANIHSVKPERIQKKLIDEKEKALLSFDLARIRSDLNIAIDSERLNLNINKQELHKLFTEYNFKSLLTRYSQLFKDITGTSPESNPDIPNKSDNQINYSIINSLEELNSHLEALKTSFAIDLETTSLDVHSTQIVGISLAYNEHSSLYIPLNAYLEDTNIHNSQPLFTLKDNEKKVTQIKRNPFLQLLKPLLENKAILKIAHNGKFDYQVLKRYGITIEGLNFDTMIAAFLVYPLESVGLKDLSKRHFNYEMSTFESLFDDKTTSKNFQTISIEHAAKYASEDALFTYKLFLFLKEKLAEKQLETLFYTIECPVQIVIAEMELNGVHIDSDECHKLRDIFEEESELLKKKIIDFSGEDFNINSTKQMAHILFDKLELPVIKKTKTGRSTDSFVLEMLQDKHPIIKEIIEYRTIEKLLSTYINNIPMLLNPTTGKVHSSFNQSIVPTGRLSSTNPNLQNIPIRSEKGLMIRNIFSSSKSDSVILSADYSQIELRLMAHFSEDQAMLKAFKEGTDIHKSTAAIMFHCPIDAVTKEQRYQAKAVNFGIIYGISAFGLSRNISVPRKEAQAMIDHYFNTFPKVKEFIETTIKNAKLQGYVKTLYGRIRPLMFINSSDKQRAQFEERVSVNTILQGSAADIIKKAMISIHQTIKEKKLKSKLLIQVHDELLFEVPNNELPLMMSLVKSCMEEAHTFLLPLKVDISSANSWGKID